MLDRIFVTSLCQEYDIDPVGGSFIGGHAQGAHIDTSAPQALLDQEGSNRQGARQRQTARCARAIRGAAGESLQLYARLGLGDRFDQRLEIVLTLFGKPAAAAAEKDAQGLTLDYRGRSRR